MADKSKEMFVNTAFEQLKEQVRRGRMARAHSGQVREGEIFVALAGANVDGASFAADAVAHGATTVVAASDAALPADLGAEVVVHPEPHEALAELAAAYFHTEGLEMPVVGVTGTNGKTTITYMLEHLLAGAGRKPGVLGSISYRWPGFKVDAPLTTPDPWRLHEMFANMAGSGVDSLVMEVSSHSLDQRRVAGLPFVAAVFTNLTQDHLDYHLDMESYFQAKLRLFQELGSPDKDWVANFDDPFGRRLLAMAPRGLGFGLSEPPADLGANPETVRLLRGKLLRNDIDGVELRMSLDGQSWTLSSPMVGRHNASNLLAVQAAGLCLGLSVKDLRALEGFAGVPGRLERVENARNLRVFVDFAHTPDALENVLSALKPLTEGRLWAVFGCGGNRDRGKRPLMAQAVCRHADVAVLTSDNPRKEDPLLIMADARPGLSGCVETIEEPDRRTAIEKTLAAMGDKDVLVVAGKGHETYQILGDVKIHYSDQEVIREWRA